MDARPHLVVEAPGARYPADGLPNLGDDASARISVDAFPNFVEIASDFCDPEDPPDLSLADGTAPREPHGNTRNDAIVFT